MSELNTDIKLSNRSKEVTIQEYIENQIYPFTIDENGNLINQKFG